MLGKFGETLVMDWGLAKVVGRSPEIRRTSTEVTLMPASGSGSTETQMGSALGTPQYMSPEQAAGRWDVVDPSTDIYSLGATLYTLLTGATPFPKENWPALQQKIQRGTFPRPRQVCKDTPAALEAVCLKAMAMNAEDRYASATALARDVEHWLADEPVTAWREPATVKARRWMRRRRSLVAGLVSLLLAAVVALTAGTILLGVKQTEVQAERNAARSAEAQARSAEAQARSAEAQARAINRFLTEDLLFQAAPEKHAREKKVTVEEVLHKAAKNIEGNRNLAGQPEIEAALQLVIGNTLDRLGDPKGAEPHFRRALALRRQALGPTHPDTLTAQEDLAFHIGSRLWQVAEAAELGRATWEGRIQAHGPEDPRTLESLDTYCNTLAQLGQLAEAEKLSRQCLEARERVQGKSHKQTLQSMNNLGVQLSNQGRFAEAEAILVECLGRHDDPNHAETLSVRSNLGFARLCMGRFAEAEATLRESLPLCVKLTGQASFQSLYFQHNLARTLAASGKLEEAERLAREVVAGRREILPARHLHIGRSLVVLGNALLQRAKWADADPILSEALDIFRQQPNAEDWIAEAQVMRGAAVAGLGRFQEAEPLLAASWPRLAADRRVPTWHKRQAAETIAKVYDKAGKTAEADAWRKKIPSEGP